MTVWNLYKPNGSLVKSYSINWPTWKVCNDAQKLIPALFQTKLVTDSEIIFVSSQIHKHEYRLLRENVDA